MRKVLVFCIFLFTPAVAFAGDAATVVFKSGQVAKIEDGYRQIVNAMTRLNDKSEGHKILEMEIGGGTFLLNVSEVVIVCRDDCRGLKVQHQLDPARSK